MKKDQKYEYLINWIPEDGYGKDEDESTTDDDVLEGIDQTDTGC